MGAKLCLPRLLLATAGPSPGLLAAPDKGASQSLPEWSLARVLAPASTSTISPLFFTTRLSACLPVATRGSDLEFPGYSFDNFLSKNIKK